MNESLEEFMKIIRYNPKEVMNPKYDHIYVMFPQEYVKALKNYINLLSEEILI